MEPSRATSLPLNPLQTLIIVHRILPSHRPSLPLCSLGAPLFTHLLHRNVYISVLCGRGLRGGIANCSAGAARRG